ncbi:unnamed protein product [Effrenium voratum]|nr:unnamed protein product [Effrenium voratum]
MVNASELVCGSLVRVRAGRDFDAFKAGAVGKVVDVNTPAETCEVLLQGEDVDKSVVIACRYLEQQTQLSPAPVQSKTLAVQPGTTADGTGNGLVTMIGPVMPCYDGLSKWKGCAMAANGKLYCAPYHAQSILVIDVSTQQLSHIELGVSCKDECKWSGIAAGIDGCLYCAPCSADSILVVDPEDDSVSYITGAGEGSYKWSGIISASDGLLYCAPASSEAVLFIDPKSRQLQRIPGAGRGGSKWSGIAEGPNGNLYCAPSMAMAVLEIDRRSQSLHRIEGALDDTSYKYKWSGITRACNGLLYCAPYNASSILVIDAAAGELDFIRGAGSGDCKWSGIGPGLDGRLYCVPSRAQEILAHDMWKKQKVELCLAFQALMELPDHERVAQYRALCRKWHPDKNLDNAVAATEDSGRSWRKAWGRHHGLHSWISHPTRRAWALVSWWNGACDKAKVKGSEEEKEDPDKDKPCTHRLMLTTDLGKSFLQIAPYVVQFSWGSEKLHQSDRIYYTAYASKTGDQGKLSLWTTEVDFKSVDVNDKGRPSAPVVRLKHGNKFMISNEFILVAKVKSEEKQTVNLMVSSDGATTWKGALLPSGMGELEEKWYTIVDTSEGAVLLHLNSDAEEKDTGRVFVSDSEGYKYSQSLLHNVRSATGEVELDKVVSLNGVYLANVVASADIDPSYEKAKQAAAETMEQDASEGSSVDRRHGRGFSTKPGKSGKEERTIRTVISFDKAGR